MGKIVRTLSKDGLVLCCAVDSTDAISRMEQIHKTSAVVTAAEGRLLTAASIIGTMLKSTKDSVTLRMEGNGPAGMLIAVSDGTGNVKGYVGNPVVEIPLNRQGKLDVAGAVGNDGFLYVIKDMGMKEPSDRFPSSPVRLLRTSPTIMRPANRFRLCAVWVFWSTRT